MLNNNHKQSIKGVMASEFDIFSVEVLGHGLGKKTRNMQRKTEIARISYIFCCFVGEDKP